MKVIIHDKNSDVTDDDRTYVQEKFSKLSRFLSSEPTVLETHFEKQRGIITVHITITHPGEKTPDHFDEKGQAVREVVNLVKERIEKHLQRKNSRAK